MPEQLFERKLAAVVAADIVGFSRLMGLDETGTLTRLTALRRTLIEPTINHFHGRIVKLMGDGILIEFPSVVDALSCSVQIQQELVTLNESQPEGQRIEYRIGINLGDIIVEGNDIFGDGVNIAARLEPLAEPGGICLSQVARDAVGNKLPLDYENMGAQTLKNIAAPVQAFRVKIPLEAVTPLANSASYNVAITDKRPLIKSQRLVAATVTVLLLAMGSTLFWWLQNSEKVYSAGAINSFSDKPSIAVMPFENLSREPDRDYFSDGVTEDLITDLSTLSGLLVISRSAMSTYKGRTTDAIEVASKLGVQFVLTGSVRDVENRLRINVQLTDVSTNTQTWAQRFDGKMEDIFDLQDNITTTIVDALAIKLTPREKGKLTQRTTENLEAYEYYQKGRSYLFSAQRELGREFLYKAIELDSSFSLAYSALAYSHSIEVSFGHSIDPDAELKIAFGLATKALSMDSESPVANFTLGMIYLLRGQHEKSINACNRALAANPNYSFAYTLIGWSKALMGDYEEGARLLSHAVRLQPTENSVILALQGAVFYLMDRFEEAQSILESTIEVNPNLLTTRLFMAATYQQLGLDEDASWQAQETLVTNPDFRITEWNWMNAFKNQNDPKVVRLKKDLQKVGLEL